MLTHIQVRDFTLVEQMELELHKGLTALTGETGAGKSILLGALGLAIGDRADASKVRSGAPKTEVSACFDLSLLPRAQAWLHSNELTDVETENECILRRVLTAEGRSRAFINGQAATITQLRELGNLLINIHSQHEHQALLKQQSHKYLLDEFGQNQTLATKTKAAYNRWAQAKVALDDARSSSEEENARYQLLKYQVEELDDLALLENEVTELENRQKQLENAEQLTSTCQAINHLCEASDDSIVNQLNTALYQLRPLIDASSLVNDAATMLDSALIQVQEAANELARQADSIDQSGEELRNAEQRLTTIYDIARKHRVQPTELFALHQNTAEQLNSLKTGDERLELLENELKAAETNYRNQAQKLTKARSSSRNKLVKAVNAQLKSLSMEHAKFEIALEPITAPSKHGSENIEFLISTTPNQPPLPLHKIASGGELSRISLAIQVITAQTSTTPTLVFDEVDVGIGGSTGDKVGRQLRALSEATQVLCVTHLAQVASKAHQHLMVNKSLSAKKVSSKIVTLTGENKIKEIARMMGGDTDSKQSIAHAKEMIGAD